MLQDVHTRKEGTVDAAFGLINSLTRNKRVLSISPIQGTLHSLFAISLHLKNYPYENKNVRSINQVFLGRKALRAPLLKLKA